MVDVEARVYGECGVEGEIPDVATGFGLVAEIAVGLDAWRWEGQVLVAVVGVSTGGI